MNEPCCSVDEVAQRVAHLEGLVKGIDGKLDLIVELGGLKPEPGSRGRSAWGSAVLGAGGAGLGFGLVEGLRRWLNS